MIRFPITQGGFLQKHTVTYNKGKERIDSAEIRLVEDANGFRHWTCECDTYRRTKWCNHIYHAYGANSKMPLGVEKVDPYELFIDSSPAVVIFAKDAILLVPVLILPVDAPADRDNQAALGEVLALWGDPKRESATNFSYEGSESLGFVEVFREGRGSLRRLILEWLAIVPILHPKDMECRSTFHEKGESWTDILTPEDIAKFTEGAKITATPKGALPQESIKRNYYRDVYNLLDTNMCSACDEAGHVDMDIF